MDIILFIILLFVMCWLGTSIAKDLAERNMVKISMDYDDVNIPRRAHKADAGYDLFATHDIYVNPHGKVTADTGVHIEIPAGYFGDIRPKSGLLFNHDIFTAGTVDSGYRGAVKVRIINFGNEPYQFRKGEKIAQMVLVPCLTPDLVIVEELPETERGNGGFGSTGK